MRVTIEFSKSVEPALCNIMINGVAWTKTGQRKGYVDVDPGRAGCSWFAVRKNGSTEASFTMTLSGANWAFPRPRQPLKTVTWVDGSFSSDSKLVYVE